MKKKIADINEHEFLRIEVKNIEERCIHFDERLSFLKKQNDNLINEVEEYKKAFWEKVEAYCEIHGLLPSEYKKDLCNIALDKELGIIFCEEIEENDPAMMVRSCLIPKH